MKNIYLSIILLLILTSNVFAQAPYVLSFSPSSQLINAEPSENIVINFSMDMDTESLNDTTLRVFGRWSGPALGEISWENGDSSLVFDPDEDFMNGEWIMVSLSKEITSLSGEFIEKGYAWNYWIKTEAGSLQQTEVDVIEVRYPNEDPITCYGAYAGDINNDGYSDLSVINEHSNDVRLFLNDGAGGYDEFEAFDLLNGDTPSPNEGGDFNNDGIIDLAIANTLNDQVSILIGDGIDGFLEEESYTADTNVRGIGILDSDADGDDDILTANRIGNNMSLLINDGSGSFEDPINFETGANTESGIAIADANGDGIMDVFIAGFNSEEVIVMLGDGNNNFTFQDQSDLDGRPWMITVGDVNNDGFVDVVSANSNGNKVGVMFGDGLGNISEATEYVSEGFPLAIDLGDIDGDGDLDMMSSNFYAIKYFLYENDGNGNFAEPIFYNASAAASCTILHDRDNDGDLDISGIDELDDLVILFENDTILSSVSTISNEIALELYPNPFSSELIINYPPAPNKGNLKLYSIDGKMLLSRDLIPKSEKLRLKTGELEPGFYLIELIYDDEKIASKKILKSK